MQKRDRVTLEASSCRDARSRSPPKLKQPKFWGDAGIFAIYLEFDPSMGGMDS